MANVHHTLHMVYVAKTNGLPMLKKKHKNFVVRNNKQGGKKQ